MPDACAALDPSRLLPAHCISRGEACHPQNFSLIAVRLERMGMTEQFT